MTLPLLFDNFNLTEPINSLDIRNVKVSTLPDVNASRKHARDILNLPVGLEKKSEQLCTYTEQKRYTKTGQVIRASSGITCSQTAGCSLELSFSSTEGRSISVDAGFNLFDIISVSTSIEFTEETTYSVTENFSISGGQSGYAVFTPTYLCTSGHYDGCSTGGPVEACTPLLTGKQPIGEYSFVSTS